MSTRTTLVIVVVLLFVSVLAGTLLWNRLPDPMASHWDVNDRVNGTTPKFWGVFLPPLMALVLCALFLLIPAIDPLKANIAKFRQLFNLFIALMMLFLTYVYGLSLAWNLGFTHFPMRGLLLPALGLLFVFTGFMLRRAKRNFFIGIRTPWTLSSDRVWDETHRVGSWLFMGSGLLAIVGSFFGGAAAFWFLFVPLIVSGIFLVVYSYVLYQQEPKA
ncbi:MAG TPA: SdpI family protein [Anaerolineales bacterium]|nr:SdpI family protein [Anaerolineales bacterium]